MHIYSTDMTKTPVKLQKKIGQNCGMSWAHCERNCLEKNLFKHVENVKKIISVAMCYSAPGNFDYHLVLLDYWIFHNRSSKIIGQKILIGDRLYSKVIKRKGNTCSIPKNVYPCTAL